MRLPHDFTPRPYQIPVCQYLDNGGRRAVCVWHRRSGKDLNLLHETCVLMHRRTGVYWHIFPTAEQGRKAIWEGFTKDGKRIMEQVFPKEIRKSPREFLPKAEMVVELNCGSIWRLLGSDRIEVVGSGPVGVVFSEYSIAKPSTWQLMEPMLAENEGWAAFAYTPRGNNHGKKLYDMARADPTWYCDLKTIHDTRAFDPAVTIQAARSSGTPEPLIRQEYLCDWTAAMVGSIWGDLIETMEHQGRLAAFSHESDGVFTAWDLGISDSTAIWFFRIGPSGMPDIIDYYESRGKPLSHYFNEVEAKGYKYIKHWLPHDARARSLQTGMATIEQFVKWCGPGNVAIGPELSLLDGIQAVRWLLQQDIRIHNRCAEGIEALKDYRYAYDEDRKTFSGKPEHGWSSHASDAMRYLACVAKSSGIIAPRAKVKEVPKTPYRDVQSFALEDLWDTARGAKKGRTRI